MFYVKTDRDKSIQHGLASFTIHSLIASGEPKNKVWNLCSIFRLLFLVSIVDNTFGGDEAALECDTQGKTPRYQNDITLIDA